MAFGHRGRTMRNTLAHVIALAVLFATGESSLAVEPSLEKELPGH